MRIIAKTGNEELACVTIAETSDGRRFEFVESLQPPFGRERKWVNVISTLFGCPVKCKICDAGTRYRGKLTVDEMLFQLDTMIERHWPSKSVPSAMWKIQFSRMGDPAFNDAVIDVLRLLPHRYDAPGLVPSLSTVAPKVQPRFYGELLRLKHELYPRAFQFQYSIHSTDSDARRALIPIDCWSFVEMARYGERWFSSGGRKITLNFALAEGIPIEPERLRAHFTPEVFIIKITPVNPTFRARASGIIPIEPLSEGWKSIVMSFRDAGYDVIESVGEQEENLIGSNCGQYVQALEQGNNSPLVNAYSFPRELIAPR